MEHTDERNKIDLMSYAVSTFRALWRMRFVAAVLVVAGAVLMTLYGYLSYSPVYEVSTSFTVKIINPLYSNAVGYNSQTAEQMEKTFPYILSSNALKTSVKEYLGVDSLPYVTASVTKGTNVFTLKVRGDDPEYIYKVLSAVIECYPDVAEYVLGPTQMILISEAFVPSAPVNSVNYVKNIVLGGAAGFVVAAAIALFLAVMSNTVTDEESLKRLLNIPCLGAIPAVKTVGKTKRPLITDPDRKHGFSDAVNMMRIRLEKELEAKNKKVVLVSSALPSEGKTTVSVNLAVAMAQKGKKVLLVDCDMRNPSVAEAFGMKNELGLAEYLEKKAPMQSIISTSGVKNLFVVTAGVASGEDTVELLSDIGFRVMIDSCKGVFDFIILDTPPCGILADASDVAGVAESAVIVVRRDYASKGQILDGVMILNESKMDVVGCVLNGAGSGESYGYYSYYSYGKYGYGRYGYGHYGYGSRPYGEEPQE